MLTLVLTVCIGSGLAHVGTSTLPFQIGAIVSGRQYGAGQAGVFGFAQSAALALSMVGIAPWVGRVAPRVIAIAGCFLAASANLGLLSAQSLGLVLILGAVAGTGYGLVFSATVATAAATSEPDRLYAIGNGGALLLISAALAGLPLAAAHLGALGIFAALAVLALVCMPFFLAFRKGKTVDIPQLSAWRTPGAGGLLFAWIMYSGGTGATYAYSERIGASFHLTQAQIASVLSGGILAGVVGTVAAAASSRRINRSWALITGTLGSGGACLALGYSTSLVPFAIAVFAYWIFCMFLYSYLLGTAAVLDPMGRVGTLGGGLEKLGVGVGVFLAGQLAQHVTYSSTGLLGFVSCLIGLSCGYPSVFCALARSERSDPSSIYARE